MAAIPPIMPGPPLLPARIQPKRARTPGLNLRAEGLARRAPPGTDASDRVVPRPTVKGRFLYADNAKLWVKGVTYGTFRPDAEGEEFHDADRIERDFAAIAAAGMNAVRVYTAPPRWLLDTALRHGLRVMVGLPWEQHVAFLDDRRRARAIEERVRAAVRQCAGHAALLCYVVGNEIPAAIVRWHGRRRIELYLERLYRAAKSEDPGSLVTYVNFPTTEYLDLPFLDLCCFNVYLECPERLSAYLARLQNLAGERPLLLAELGLDSRSHGPERQACMLDAQIQTAFAAGCAGVFAFAWTDEWHRGGHDIEDWDFGLTDRDRRPKPALAAVREAFCDVPFPRRVKWPKISVVVCSRNGARTIRDCFEGLSRLEYPSFEVVVVDDGSHDGTDVIAREYGFRLLGTGGDGLGSARNAGLAAASGEIVAYIDDDAWPDPHWLHYVAATFMERDVVAVGGPNLAPQGDGFVADGVAQVAGGPIHVLLTDREAEHIPGCNMAFRKEALDAVGGFDPRFRTAGDDVDVCWRLQERGWKLGFHPAAIVWHHRRNTLSAYWKQQRGYGRAEALLERKWPQKYNAAGHHTWRGRLYGGVVARLPGSRCGKVYHGAWGDAPFQSLYEPAPGLLSSLPSMPEWYLLVAALAALSLLGAAWAPLLWTLPLLALGVVWPLSNAVAAAARATLSSSHRTPAARAKLRGWIAVLLLVQPAARLCGRLAGGLKPWRALAGQGVALPRSRRFAVWSEAWRAPAEWLRSVEAALKRRGDDVRRGGDFDAWDLEVRGGSLAAVRLVAAVEEHGAGRQLARFKITPRLSVLALAPILVTSSLSLAAALDGARAASVAFAALLLAIALRALAEYRSATREVAQALARAGAEES